MSNLPSRGDVLDLNVGLPRWASQLIAAYAEERLLDREAIELVGWFHPQSKRFIYSDEKKHEPQKYAGYTEQVGLLPAALGDEP